MFSVVGQLYGREPISTVNDIPVFSERDDFLSGMLILRTTKISPLITSRRSLKAKRTRSWKRTSGLVWSDPRENT